MKTCKEMAKLWGVTERTVTTFCKTGKIQGAEKEETDKLKSVLAEVLQDLRKQKKCYVRYEFKQGCFHITVR